MKAAAAVSSRLFSAGEIPRVLNRKPPQLAVECVAPDAVAKQAAPPALVHQLIVRIPTAGLLAFLSGERMARIPKSAKILGCWIDTEYDGTVINGTFLCLRIEHESLPALEVGRQIPRIEVAG